MKIRSTALIAVILVGSTTAEAQRFESSGLEGSRIRIQFAGDRIEKGRFLGVFNDTLYFTMRANSHAVRGVAMSEVGRMWTAGHASMLKRSIKYGTIGLLAGAAAGYAVGSAGYDRPVTKPVTYDTYFFGPITLDECTAHCSDPTPADRALQGALLGALSGALLSQVWDGPWSVLRFR